MRKIKLVTLRILVGLSFVSSAYSQIALDGDDQVGVMAKGDYAVNAYYGINVFTSIAKAAYQNSTSNQSNFTIKGMGPVGANFEYMVTDEVGMGLDMYYANTTASWQGDITKQVKDASGYYNDVTNTYNYKVSIPRYGVLLRCNVHFIKDEHFDGYGIVGMGYKNNSFVFKTDDPDFIGQRVGGLLPLGFKLGLGFRYFFNDFVGLHTELALGSPILGGGMSFKF